MKKLISRKSKSTIVFVLILIIVFNSIPHTNIGISYALDSKFSISGNDSVSGGNTVSGNGTVSDNNSVSDGNSVSGGDVGDGSVSDGDSEHGSVSDGDSDDGSVSDGDSPSEEIPEEKVKVVYKAISGGSVSAGDTINIQGEIELIKGENLVVELRPNLGKRVRQILVDKKIVPYADCYLNEAGYYEYVLRNITEDVELSAYFTNISVVRNIVSLEDIGIIVLDQNGKILDCDESNCYYGKSITVSSGDGDSYHLKDQEKYEFVFEIDESLSISNIYERVKEPQDFDSEKNYHFQKPINLVIDNTPPTLVIGEEDTNIWLDKYAGTISLRGKAIDENLDYVVWSEIELEEADILNSINRTECQEDGAFCFSNIEVLLEKDTKTFYLYAVDKAENCSEASTVKVYRDGTAAVITDISIVSEEDALNKLSYGTFTSKEIKLRIKAQDVTQEGTQQYQTSGVQAVVIYSGSVATPVIKEEISEPIQGTDEMTIDISIPYLENGEFAALSELCVRVVDAMGNVSADYKLTDFMEDISSYLMIEQSAPSVEIEVASDSKAKYEKEDGEAVQYWYSEIPDFTYIADDMQQEASGSGLAERTLLLNGENIEEFTKCDYSEVDSYEAVQQKENSTINADLLANMVQGENELQIIFEDIAGNIGQDNVKIYLDNRSPVITDFFVCMKDSDELSQSNQYAFGNYYNDAVEITVYAVDDLDESGYAIASVGLKSITLYLDGVEYETTEEIIDGKAVFMIPKEQVSDEEKLYLDTVISASAMDLTGNISAIADMTEVEDGYGSSSLMIEKVAPLLEIFPVGNFYNEKEKILYTREAVELIINVYDEHSGLQSTEVFVNGQLLESKQYSDDVQERCKTDRFTVNTKDASISNENLYEIQVVVTDNAGNQKTDTINIYEDITAPEIVAFEMRTNSRLESSGNDVSVADRPYGYYFQEKVSVFIYTTDGDRESDCGVKEILYYTTDSRGNKSEIQRVTVSEEGYAVIELPVGFKGQIYACAYDFLQNAPEDFVSPKALIIESQAIHSQESHISFGKEGSSKVDKNGLELYAKEVSVVITVSDTMSGISNVEWSISAPYDVEKNVTGYAHVDNEGNISADSGEWTKIATDKNLVTSMNTTVSVVHNSNDITLTVKMTDRAGHVSYDECTFSIDTTQPIMNLTFDNTTTDSTYTDVYNSERIATITVKERNFSVNDIIAEITNAYGEVPKFSDWIINVNENEPDETISTAQIVFAEDGEYTLRIIGADSAGNVANVIEEGKFIIDKTAPEIRVTYDNNSAQNGNYYAQGRNASISVTERNFAPERVTLTGTVEGDIEEVEFPLISQWNREGDVYTAVIDCVEDGFYYFTVEYADQAGNTGETFASERFHIDTVAPKIQISGVENYSANNGDVIPVISLSDSNYDIQEVTIELEGANNGKMEPDGQFMQQESGQTFIFANFPKEKAYDDVYTIKVVLSDLAGNNATESISFSVNRFGSVYIFDEKLKEIAGTYVKEEIDVKVTEINIDSLEHDTIKVAVAANGNVRDLAEGQDYTIYQSRGDGSWYQYEYVIDRSIFAGDGRYIVTLYSQDQAGNVNQNIDENKKAEISFGVDKTAPIVIPLDIESNTQYSMDALKATVAINDNLVLGDVAIYVNSRKATHEVSGENYLFMVPESDEPQNIMITATDMAGNMTTVVVRDVLVTTNMLISWLNNKPLFVGSIAGAVTISGIIVWLILLLRRRKSQE